MRPQWGQKADVARQIHSLPSGAPATLEELRQLKSAAQQLENEVRGRSIVPPAESPLIEQTEQLRYIPAPNDVMRTRRIRRKAVPTILALESVPVAIKGPTIFTLDVAPLPDTPRSGTSSSASFSSGPFDLSTGSSASDLESNPPLTPPHAMVAFSHAAFTPSPIRASSSESAGLRRSEGVPTGLRVSPSLPLYIPSVHGEIDGWWSSSDEDHGDSSDEADGDADVDTESDSAPTLPVPTFEPVRRGPGFHMRSVSDDTALPVSPPKKGSFYGNKTAFMSTFFSKSTSTPSPATPIRSSSSKSTPPSSWTAVASPPPSPTSTSRAIKRSSMQFLPGRPAPVSSPVDCTDTPADTPKKSFYANSKAFRSVRDLGALKWGDKDKEEKKEKEKDKARPALPDSPSHKRKLSNFFRKLAA